MHRLNRWLLLALVSLAAIVGWSPAQAATPLDRNLNAAALSLTPEANAPPEYGRCIKTAGGAYKDAACTETAGASEKSYEWYAAFGSAHPLEKVGFSNVIKEGTAATLETVSGTTVHCEGESSTGEYTGNKMIGNIHMTLTKCAAFGLSCQSAGAAAATIVAHTLEGTLGVEELAAEPVNYKIGQDLYPAGHTGSVAEFKCGIPLTISGSIISPLTANSMKLAQTIKTKALKGKQKPESFVGGSAEVLMSQIESSTPEQAGLTLTTTQTSEEKVEVNSVV
jgi:hypothetical protein